MSSHPTPTRKDHEDFCVIEGWVRRRSAKGKRGTHHVNYDFALPDGRIVYTRISHPVDRTNYGPAIWSHTLRDQLAVTSSEFWQCVEHRVLPERGAPALSKEPIPLGVLRALRDELHLTEAELRSMSKAQAVQRLADFYTTGEWPVEASTRLRATVAS